MDDLLAQFLIEGRDLVLQAYADLEQLASDREDRTALDDAFRAIHTLKGSVAIFDMAPAERVLHAAEDVLHHAREDRALLSPATLEALVACVDQVDRWIDSMEQSVALPGDAPGVAASLLAGLAQTGMSDRVGAPESSADWANALRDRLPDRPGGMATPLVAFRYRPDGEAFFRGDDPLAVVKSVPDLRALSVGPTGTWPAIDEWDPFRCLIAFEGVSGAAIDEVRRAFRLVGDQVEVSPIAAETGPAEAQEDVTSSETRLLRVPGARIDELTDGLGELIIAVNALSAVADRAGDVDAGLATGVRAAQAGIEQVLGRLHRSIETVRLVPLSAGLRRLPRLVRQIAGSLSKEVRFELSGDTLAVDKEIADGLFEPLLHLVRNALDHGIETAGARLEAGKSAAGLLRLAVARVGDAVTVTLSDDGAGIDPDRIREHAVRRGIIARDAAEGLDDQQAVRLIFMPGFSTADRVTDLSGRGVGMDAVQVAISRMRGQIDVHSQLGAGTTIVLRLPLNAITTRLLVVSAGGEDYGVRLDQIAETVRLDDAQLADVGMGQACVLRDRTVPILDMAQLLGRAPEQSKVAKLLVTHAAGQPVALRVEGFGHRIDALVRDKGKLLAGIPAIGGTTLLSDGAVLLVLDLPELIG